MTEAHKVKCATCSKNWTITVEGLTLSTDARFNEKHEFICDDCGGPSVHKFSLQGEARVHEGRLRVPVQGEQAQECPRCAGVGELVDACPNCEGKGRYEFNPHHPYSSPDGDKEEECPDCGGTGTSCCPDCSGTGEEGELERAERLGDAGPQDESYSSCDALESLRGDGSAGSAGELWDAMEGKP